MHSHFGKLCQNVKEIYAKRKLSPINDIDSRKVFGRFYIHEKMVCSSVAWQVQRYTKKWQNDLLSNVIYTNQ